ncbi:MAG TPA: hypothetical protein VK718_06075 [Ferruginibacter sp.]|jgi:hypothetical protein|nr:hypothetical protein [Ferruginibacter sp.]
MLTKIKAVLILMAFAMAFLLIIYMLVGRFFFNALLLKRNGKCGKAILTNMKVFQRYQETTMQYQFTYNGKKYNGDSLEKDFTKVGDSICIVYLESDPGINLSVKYFTESNMKVDCDCVIQK